MHPFHAIRPLHIRHAGLYEVHAAGTQTKARVLVVKLTPLGVGAAAAAQQCAHRTRDIGVLLLAQITGNLPDLVSRDWRETPPPERAAIKAATRSLKRYSGRLVALASLW